MMPATLYGSNMMLKLTQAHGPWGSGMHGTQAGQHLLHPHTHHAAHVLQAQRTATQALPWIHLTGEAPKI